jgi:hypothetical protein
MRTIRAYYSLVKYRLLARLAAAISIGFFIAWQIVQWVYILLIR